MTGLSAVIGSWKTMPMLVAAQPAERARRERRVAVEHDLAAGDAPRGPGRRPRMARSVMVLPQPDSPTRPERPAARDVEG